MAKRTLLDDYCDGTHALEPRKGKEGDIEFENHSLGDIVKASEAKRRQGMTLSGAKRQLVSGMCRIRPPRPGGGC